MSDMKQAPKRYGMGVADNMIEPHPSWNGRECIRLAPGVIRFLDEQSPKYHLIAEWRLVES